MHVLAPASPTKCMDKIQTLMDVLLLFGYIVPCTNSQNEASLHRRHPFHETVDELCIAQIWMNLHTVLSDGTREKNRPLDWGGADFQGSRVLVDKLSYDFSHWYDQFELDSFFPFLSLVSYHRSCIRQCKKIKFTDIYRNTFLLLNVIRMLPYF